jgi:hypothetical protein
VAGPCFLRCGFLEVLPQTCVLLVEGHLWACSQELIILSFPHSRYSYPFERVFLFYFCRKIGSLLTPAWPPLKHIFSEEHCSLVNPLRAPTTWCRESIWRKVTLLSGESPSSVPVHFWEWHFWLLLDLDNIIAFHSVGVIMTVLVVVIMYPIWSTLMPSYPTPRQTLWRKSGG